MNISIIGTGAVGGAIAKKLAKSGHQVKIANSQGKGSLEAFAQEIGAEAYNVENITSDSTDVLILSIPIGAIPKLPKSVFENLPKNSIIIDTSNYYPEIKDAKIEAIDNGKVESVWVSEQIGRPIIKTFNNLLASSLAEKGKPKGNAGRLAMQVAGDDEKQKKIVEQLVDECGFDAFDNGDLANSWTQQPTSAGYCCDYTVEELREIKNKSSQTPQSVVKNRFETTMNFATLTSGDFSVDNIILVNRKYNI